MAAILNIGRYFTNFKGHIGENEIKTKPLSRIVYAYSITTKWVAIGKY